MGTCDIPDCGGDESLSFTCNECENTYCSTHRLPEAHHCRELRSDSLTWPVGDSESDSETLSRKPEPMDMDSLPTAKTTDETKSRNRTKAISRSSQESSSDKSPATPSFLGRVGSALTNAILFPIEVAIILLETIWKRKLLLTMLALVIIGAVAFGPLSFAAVLPGELAEDIDHALKSAGNDTERAVADVTDTSLNATKVEALVHERINEIRKNRGLPPIDHDPTLREIASEYSRSMATNGFYSHTSPSGETFEDRYKEEGFNCRIPISDDRYVTGAENIQYTFAFTEVTTTNGTVYYDSEKELARGLVRAWMNSKGHRENILKPYWHNEGIGVYITENPNGPGMKVYATQNFC